MSSTPEGFSDPTRPPIGSPAPHGSVPYAPPGKPPSSGGGSAAKTTCLVISLVFGGLGLCCLLGVGAIAFFVVTAKELPITQQDRDVILDAEALSDFTADLRPEVAEETLSKTQSIDRSIELNYEYEEMLEDEGVFLSYTLFVDTTKSDADTTYRVMWGVSTAGMKIGGGSAAAVDERNDIFSWGDRSRFGILMYQGEPTGNLFVAQLGNKTVVFILGGLYFDDGGFGAFARPYLEKLRSYQP